MQVTTSVVLGKCQKTWTNRLRTGNVLIFLKWVTFSLATVFQIYPNSHPHQCKQLFGWLKTIHSFALPGVKVTKD